MLREPPDNSEIRLFGTQAGTKTNTAEEPWRNGCSDVATTATYRRFNSGVEQAHLLAFCPLPLSTCTMARDNFKKTVIEDLAKRVAYLCSNPDCLAQTIGPNSDVQGAVNIGEAAHITAASPGGPRYDVGISSEDRASFTNGIWLCRSCAARIDRDVKGFPVAKLQRWKQQAEARALMGFNRRTQVITDQPSPSVFTAISPMNALAHAGKSLSSIASALESKDPRFKVSVSHDGTSAKVKLHAAAETVEMIARLTSDAESTAQMKQFLEFGITANFNGGELAFEGSALFEELGKDAEFITLENFVDQHSVVKIAVVEIDGQNTHSVVESPIKLSRGSKGISCHADLLGGFMVFAAHTDGQQLHFQLTPNYDCWITPSHKEELVSLEKLLTEKRLTEIRVTEPLGLSFFEGALADKTIHIMFSKVHLTARQRKLAIGKPIPVKISATEDTRVSYLVS